VFASVFGGAADAQPLQPAARQSVAVQANGLYAPPGYRQRTPQPQPAAPPERATGGGGRVMYFTKPADALVPDDLPADGVAMAPTAPQLPTTAGADVPKLAPAPALQPGPRSLPAIPTATPPVVLPTPTALPAHPPSVFTTTSRPRPTTTPEAQPPAESSTTAQRQPNPKVPLDPKVTELPSRDKIFLMYNDTDLSKVIVNSLIDEQIRRRAEAERENAKRVKEGLEPFSSLPPNPQPADSPEWQFPTPTRVVPEGTRYAAKTSGYEPRTARVEPTFVVHRRLHFEEKNAERYGWDLGIIQPFVSTMYFYRDTLLWPQSLVSGCVVGPWDTSAGKCKPGSPVPYNLYPPGLTITGTVAEGALITGLSWIIP
jgi:hypothetical protein